MGCLSSGLAHELRNPLQNVVARTSELLEGARTGGTDVGVPDTHEYLRRACAEAKRAEHRHHFDDGSMASRYDV